MHEYSLVQSLLDQIESIRVAEKADRVVSVRVNIGEFSGIEPDLFHDAFEVLIDATPASGATLELLTTPLTAKCNQCGERFRVAAYRFECLHCSSTDISINTGEDIILEAVTLEQHEPPEKNRELLHDSKLFAT